MALELEVVGTDLLFQQLTAAQQQISDTLFQATLRNAVTPIPGQPGMVSRVRPPTVARQTQKVTSGVAKAVVRAERKAYTNLKQLSAPVTAAVKHEAAQLIRAGASLNDVQKKAEAALLKQPGGAAVVAALHELRSTGSVSKKTNDVLQAAQREFLKNPKAKAALAKALAPIADAKKQVNTEISKLAQGLPGDDADKRQAAEALAHLANSKIDVDSLQKLGTAAGRELLTRYGKKYGEKALRETLSRVPSLKVPYAGDVGDVVGSVGQQLLSGNFSPKQLTHALVQAGEKKLISKGKEYAIEYGAKAVGAIAPKLLAVAPIVGPVTSALAGGNSYDGLRKDPACKILEWEDVVGLKAALAKGAVRGVYAGGGQCNLGMADPRFHLFTTPDGVAWALARHRKLVPEYRRKAQELKAYQKDVTAFAADIRKRFPAGDEGLRKAVGFAESAAARAKDVYGRTAAHQAHIDMGRYGNAATLLRNQLQAQTPKYDPKSVQWAKELLKKHKSASLAIAEIKKLQSANCIGCSTPTKTAPTHVQTVEELERLSRERYARTPASERGKLEAADLISTADQVCQRYQSIYSAKDMPEFARKNCAAAQKYREALQYLYDLVESKKPKDKSVFGDQYQSSWKTHDCDCTDFETNMNPPACCLLARYRNDIFCEETARAAKFRSQCKPSTLAIIDIMTKPLQNLLVGGPVYAIAAQVKGVSDAAAVAKANNRLDKRMRENPQSFIPPALLKDLQQRFAML